MRNPVDFLLNKGGSDDPVVDAPAFSLTKVLTVAAPVVTAAVALIADKLDDMAFRAVHVTALTVAVLGLVAIAGSADVIARSIATNAKTVANKPATVVRLATLIKAVRTMPGDDENVAVTAVSCEQPPRFLCLRADGTLTWEDEDDLRFSGVALVDVATAPSNGKRGK